jgi:transposase
MSKRLDFKLDDSELLEVTEAIHMDKRLEVRQRAVAIRLLATGETFTAVAKRLTVQPETVSKWFRRFRQDGLEGLANRPKGRPKRKADDEYCQALEEAIENDPGAYGYPFPVWTVERLRDHLETKTGTYLSSNRLRMVIRNRGYVIQHPKQI